MFASNETESKRGGGGGTERAGCRHNNIRSIKEKTVTSTELAATLVFAGNKFVIDFSACSKKDYILCWQNSFEQHFMPVLKNTYNKIQAVLELITET